MFFPAGPPNGRMQGGRQADPSGSLRPGGAEQQNVELRGLPPASQAELRNTAKPLQAPPALANAIQDSRDRHLKRWCSWILCRQLKEVRGRMVTWFGAVSRGEG